MTGLSEQDREAIDAREDAILGKPPRVAPLTPEEIDADARAAIADVVRAAGREPPAQPSEHTAILLRHPGLYRAHTALGLQLYRGDLPIRLRELAVLRIAWLTRSPYEWGEHVDVGKRMGGLSAEDVARVRAGSQASGWDECDRAVVAAVEELLADAMIGDATWAMLARHLDARQLIELPLLVGQYLGTAFFQNSLRVPLLPGNAGLATS